MAGVFARAEAWGGVSSIFGSEQWGNGHEIEQEDHHPGMRSGKRLRNGSLSGVDSCWIQLGPRNKYKLAA